MNFDISECIYDLLIIAVIREIWRFIGNLFSLRFIFQIVIGLCFYYRKQYMVLMWSSLRELCLL